MYNERMMTQRQYHPIMNVIMSSGSNFDHILFNDIYHFHNFVFKSSISILSVKNFYAKVHLKKFAV